MGLTRGPSGGGSPNVSAATGILPIANGGTNSNVALSNGFFLSSQSSAIKEQAGIYLVQPSDGGAGIQSALNAATAAGGGIVQLVAGTYTIANNAPIIFTGNNVILRGVGQSTIINSLCTQNEWAIEFLGSVRDHPSNNTTAANTSFTCTTASHGADYLAGETVVLFGTDSDSFNHIEVGIVAANGSGVTGVVTLRTPLKYSLTSVTARNQVVGYNNRLENFKMTHSAGASHSIGLLYTVNTTVKDIIGDGSTGSCSVFITIHDNVNPTLENCIANHYNIIESYLGTDSCFGMTMINCIGAKIINNVFNNCGNSTLANTPTWSLASTMEDCLFADNLVVNSQDRGVHIGSTAYFSNVNFLRNKFHRSRFDNFYTANSANFSDCTFDGNHFINAGRGTGTYSGIVFTTPATAKRMRIINNVALDSSNNGVGIDLQKFTQSVISGNVCRNNRVGLSLYLCTHSTCTSNTLNDNTLQGIDFYNCTGLNITGNNCNSNAAYGIGSDDNNVDILISGNCSIGNTTKNLFLRDTDASVLSIGNNYRGGTITLGAGTNIQSIGDLV